jgi:carbonic anhydrase
MEEVTRENVLLQLDHLRSHPSVAAGLKEGNIKLHGLIYNIGTGEVECYDQEKQAFVPMKHGLC